MPKQIPVYLFVGQLESGKTKFIQETMEDPNFDSGDKTLLLVCEEGEIEYDPKKFAFGGVHVAQIEDKSELTQENLTALEKKSGCGRVIIEYNGMWLVQELYDAMPDNWLVYQCLATADGTTCVWCPAFSWRKPMMVVPPKVWVTPSTGMGMTKGIRSTSSTCPLSA